MPEKKTILYVDKDYLNKRDPDDVDIRELHANVGYMTGCKLTKQLREIYEVTRAYDLGERVLNFMIARDKAGTHFDAMITHLPFDERQYGDYGQTTEVLTRLKKQFPKIPILGYSGIDLPVFNACFSELVNDFVPKTIEPDEDIRQIKERLAKLLNTP